jgi:hypothetical protein
MTFKGNFQIAQRSTTKGYDLFDISNYQGLKKKSQRKFENRPK